MDKLPVELKMKVFNELIEPSEIKISIVFMTDLNHNYYEDYTITKIVSPFSGKETVVCKKITKEGKKDKDEYTNENIKILQIKDIYKFIELKMLSLEGRLLIAFNIELSEEESIYAFEDELDDNKWVKKQLRKIKLYIESIW